MPHKGYKQTPEHIRKVREALRARGPTTLGYRHTETALAKMRGPRPHTSGSRHPNWTGDSPSYAAVHAWVHRNFEKTGACEECGATPDPIQMVWKGVKPTVRQATEWANISGEYHRSRDDFRELCKPCHARFDQGRK